MQIWLRKAFVIFITVITFGIVVPPIHPIINDSESKDETQAAIYEENSPFEMEEEQSDVEDWQNPDSPDSMSWAETAERIENDEELPALFTQYVVSEADKQAKQKFGPIIGEAIGDRFNEEILPELRSIIEDFSSNKMSAEDLKFIGVSEKPSGGLGEKILHIYSLKTGEDFLRFHVRRDQPPQDGYWFNFHYHEYEDQFANHHDLGKIYWDKNTPPHWVS